MGSQGAPSWFHSRFWLRPGVAAHTLPPQPILPQVQAVLANIVAADPDLAAQASPAIAAARDQLESDLPPEVRAPGTLVKKRQRIHSLRGVKRPYINCSVQSLKPIVKGV